jgi:ligand-binding sensor domain-containing protein
MFFGITEDADGGIWLGSLNGVGRYDGKDFDWFRAE